MKKDNWEEKWDKFKLSDIAREIERRTACGQDSDTLRLGDDYRAALCEKLEYFGATVGLDADPEVQKLKEGKPCSLVLLGCKVGRKDGDGFEITCNRVV